MKDLIKNILKFTLISLLLSSCEKDIYEDALAHKKDFKYGAVSFNQVKRQNPIAANTINKLCHNLKTDIQSKTTADLYGFEVDTTKIMYIEKQDGFKSYTLKIAQPTGLNYFKNLVLNEYPDGKFQVRVVKFNLSKTFEQVKLENSLRESTISNEVSKYSIPNNTVNFYTCIEVGYYNQLNVCEGNLVTPEENQECFNSDGTPAQYEVFIILEQSCGWTDAGGGAEGSTGDGGAEGPAGDGAGGTGGIADDAVFIPNILSNTEAPIPGIMPLGLAIEYFENNLDPETQLPIYNDYPELRDYLLNHNCNDAARQFALEMIAQISLNPGIFSSIKPMVIEKQIDDSQLDPCTSGILNKIKTLQQDDIAKIIARFDNPNMPFKTTFSQVPNLVNSSGNPVYGRFVPSMTENYIYEIKINSNYNGGTHLGKAAVIIHEMLHALIASVMQYNGNPNNNDLTEFPLIWNAYVNIKTGGTTPEDHDFIGNNYVTIFTEILKEYAIATGTPSTDPNLNQICTDLAWSGLFEPFSSTSNFTSLSSSDLLRISVRKKVEMENHSFNGVNPTNNLPCL